MATAKKTTGSSQSYPRITDKESSFYWMLDDSQLTPHIKKISDQKLEELIKASIANANQKSSRKILNIPDDATPEIINKICKKEGVELFKYFRKYYGDPASTAYEIFNKHYKHVAKEQFRNRTLQKQRMNSGWRYQYLARDCAKESERFAFIADIGMAEADFVAIVDLKEKKSQSDRINIFVSIKNRSNTMGGQDWPKAIRALEDVAASDKNKVGPYCCVFGLVMEKGARNKKIERKTGRAYSENTEVWLSDFFWPFFANYSYEEIMQAVLRVLCEGVLPQKELSVSSIEEIKVAEPEEIEIPEKLLESFGEACKKEGLLDENGYFDNPSKLVKFFCTKTERPKKIKSKSKTKSIKIE